MVQMAYLENQVMTATQDKLLIMMFDGAINFLKRIDNIDFDKDIEIRNYNIKKAIAIITELQCTLNMDYTDISEPLFALYDYMRNRLLEANMKQSKEYIFDVIRMLNELRESFANASLLLTPQKMDISNETADGNKEHESVCFSG